VLARPLLTVLRLIIIALIILGLARPQIGNAREIVKGEGVDIALALDISGSMASLDFEPKDRLEAAKAVIGDFVKERQYDKIGLVVFASDAFSQSPPTTDHQVLRRLLDRSQLATDIGIEDGTAIGMGLANAANMLKDSDAKSKVIILLTDGVNNAGQIDPLTAAEAAKTLGIKVYTIGMGRPGQVPVPVTDMFGRQSIAYQESALDEDVLQEIAQNTGGKYYRAEDTAGLKQIYDEINNLEKSKIEIQRYTRYHELAIWVLLPALFIFLLEAVLRKTLFRRLP
jgi:Ca-activated chloride channel family protein